MKQSTALNASDVPGPGPAIKTAYKEVCYVRHRENEGVHRT